MKDQRTPVDATYSDYTRENGYALVPADYGTPVSYTHLIQIPCGGPAKGLTVTADSHGHVKGFPMESQVELPLNAQGKLDVGGALGLGVMSVIKDMGLKEPYVGQIALRCV